MEQFFKCQPQIITQLSRKIKDQSTREDLLQEVFIKFATNLDSLKHQDNLRGYLYRITDNLIVDYYRQANRFSAIENNDIVEPDTASLEPYQHYQLADRLLRSFIDQLPSKYKEVLIWVELEGMAQKEVAEKLGISY